MSSLLIEAADTEADAPADVVEVLDSIDPVSPFCRGQRIQSAEFGDITDDVIEALEEMRQADAVIAEREQAEIALLAGREARDLKFGRLVAQVAPEVFDYWVAREGLGFWSDKGNRRKYLQKNPECAVISHSRRIMAGYGSKRQGVRGKRGRWAM